jgi:hypothetical protein
MKTVTECKVWRDDAEIHPDGSCVGGWVSCLIYEAQPAHRFDCISCKPGYVPPSATIVDVESFSDLFDRLVTQHVEERDEDE